ncbi:MAG: phosphoribosylformylglycinamidine cyclo-ligase [Candidatus Methylomirabilia bacterium]
MTDADRQATVRDGGRLADRRSSYAKVGVDTQREELGLETVLQQLEKTFGTRPDGLGSVKLPFRFFANVIEVSGTGVAISTDGVGTKILVAQLMDKYDTIGIDCVAMNVNDILCVGAEPLTMVDYIAVEKPNVHLLSELAIGLKQGALDAGITIPGGEIAQVREMIKGKKRGYGFDLAGTAVGTVPLDRILVGRQIEPDDVVLGLRSSGIHSNGLTLARRLFRKHAIGSRFEELGRTLGEELLVPTRIYARGVVEVLKSGVDVKALVHITGDGLLNLLRVESDIGYVIHSLPETPPIFKIIQSEANVSVQEMFRVFNMGIGFCLVVSHRGDHVERARAILRRHDADCDEIGRAVRSPQEAVVVEPAKLIGEKGQFRKVSRRKQRG